MKKIQEIELNAGVYEQVVTLPINSMALSMSFNGDKLMLYYAADTQQEQMQDVLCYLIPVGTEIIETENLVYTAAAGLLHLFTKVL